METTSKALSPLEALRALEAFRLSQTDNNQKTLTVERYLDAAIVKIDNCFGYGYAIKNPQLIAAFMQACAIDSVAGTLEREISHLTETIAQAIRKAV